MDGSEDRIDAIIDGAAQEVAGVVGALIPTASRRHGRCPRAVDHVRLYLLVEVAGVSPAALARSDPRHRSVVYRAIERGRRLCERRRGAGDASGFSPPDRRGAPPGACAW